MVGVVGSFLLQRKGRDSRRACNPHPFSQSQLWLSQDECKRISRLPDRKSECKCGLWRQARRSLTL